MKESDSLYVLPRSRPFPTGLDYPSSRVFAPNATHVLVVSEPMTSAVPAADCPITRVVTAKAVPGASGDPRARTCRESVRLTSRGKPAFGHLPYIRKNSYDVRKNSYDVLGTVRDQLHACTNFVLPVLQGVLPVLLGVQERTAPALASYFNGVDHALRAPLALEDDGDTHRLLVSGAGTAPAPAGTRPCSAACILSPTAHLELFTLSSRSGYSWPGISMQFDGVAPADPNLS